jgi:hypothetical protein
VSEVSKAIPLCARLSVQVVHIIVTKPFGYGLDLVRENLTTERRHIGDIERQAAPRLAEAYHVYQGDTDFTFTISPVLISRAAAATRVGVRRLRRPI